MGWGKLLLGGWVALPGVAGLVCSSTMSFYSTVRSCRRCSTAVERRLRQGGSEGESGELGRKVRGGRAGTDGTEPGERVHQKSGQ